MKISDILQEKKSGVSFEFFPPRQEAAEKSLTATLDVLEKFNPLYVSMTCGAGGANQIYTQEAVKLLLQRENLTVMPHLTCIDLDPETLKKLLDEYRSAGVENIMALRGDPPQERESFNFKNQVFSYARDLVKIIKKENYFCIGVAVYPEGHVETSSLDQDLDYTKQKIAAGADFAGTQMFFDNAYYYRLLDRFNKNNINIPVLPGILPLTNLKKVEQFASICRATIPKHIVQEIERFSDKPADQRKVGIDFTIKQCQDLIKNGITQIHFFTLNKPGVMKTILDSIGIV